MPRVAAVRASSRPKKISTRGRATCVESTRSVGSWKVPTFSEREWRSAVDAVLGANGSWTWTMSRSAAPSSGSSGAADVERHRCGAGPRPARQRDALADGEHRRAVAAGPGHPGRVEEPVRAVLGGADHLARVADGRARLRRRRDQHAVAALGLLARDTADELVDLMRAPPTAAG